MELLVNGQTHALPAAWADDRLLMVLRELLGLVGPKLGCGLGQCGACTVLVDGQPQRACLLPVQAVAGQQVTTIEGLVDAKGRLHPVQQAWLNESVPQCGYCQAGQIMTAVALLRSTPQPTAAEVDAALSPHLCRCGTQPRIRRAVMQAAQALAEAKP